MKASHDKYSGGPGTLDGVAAPTYFAFAARPASAEHAEITAPEPLPALLNDRYRLERLLGMGGMSAVYCAHDTVRARFGDPTPYVAIKVMNDNYAQYPDANALLFSEFALTQQLHHPNVIRLYSFDVECQSQRAFISMEWLQGTPLDQLINDHPKGLTWDALQPIALSALEAVAYVHRRELVHGDLKPSNLILGAEGLRLFDFGLSESINPQLSGLPRLQRERIAAWTPGYAALELHEGGPPSYAADVYALACVLYELATGQHPYQRCNARQAQAQRLDRALPYPLNLPKQSWRALQQALRINPVAGRITAEELLVAFQNGECRPWPRWMRPWREPPPAK